MLAAILVAGAQTKDEAERMLKAAKNTELVDGDLKGAIKRYGEIAAKYSKTDRAAAAMALVRMAECHQKLGDAESRKIYEQVVREYGDQKDAVAEARARLGGSRPARNAGASFRHLWNLPPTVTPRGTVVSPDGRYFAYVDYAQKGDAFLHDFITGTDRRLTNTGSASRKGTSTPTEQFADGDWAFSRDSKQLAYTWCNEKGQYEIRVVDLRGSGIPPPRRLFGSEEVDWVMPADWSPDGKWIALEIMRGDQTTQLALVSVADGSLRVLRKMEWRTRLKGAAAFSPDGKYLTFDAAASPNAQQGDIFVIAADGSSEVPAVVHPANDVLVRWSPDGKRILFTSDRTGRKDLWSLPYWDGRPQGEPELIKSGIDLQGLIGITDSGSIYSVVSPQHPTDIKVATVDFAAGKFVSPPVSPFTGMNEFPEWSPDGKYLAYISRPQAGSPIVIGIRAWETGQTRELRPKLVRLATAPRWSPDGSAFEVWGRDLDLQWGVYRIDARSGEVSLVLNASNLAGNADPCWSHDGNSLYYRHFFEQSNEVAFIERDLASKKEREIIRRPFLAGINVSPDGRFIATGGDASPNSGTRTALLIPVQGGEVRELGQTLGVFGWARDSRSVYLWNRSPDVKEGRDLFQVAIDGGSPRKLELRLDPNTTWVSIHPDGQRIAYQVNASQQGAGGPGEIWVLENFLSSLNAKK